jgi:hypothetical protein
VIALRARVESLRAARADVFDGPGFGLLEALLERAEALGGEAGTRLLVRASDRAGLIEAAFKRALDGASCEIEAMGEGAPPAAREALEGGDPRAARRALRRARVDAARSHERIAVSWAARLGSEASARGEESLVQELSELCSNGVVERGAHGRAVALGGVASAALFQASAEGLRATIAIARATDNLPESAGPYNSQVLAARALAAMAELSPAYARAVVAAIDDLASLEVHLGLEPPKARPRPAGRKRAAGGTRSPQERLARDA